MLSCMSCLYILDINPLSVISFANIFSPSVACLFILFMVSFTVQKVLSLIRSHLFIFVCISFALGDHSKKILLQSVSECSAYVFLQNFYGFQSYIQVFTPFWVYFCVWCQRMFLLHSFTCSCPVFPELLIEETFFSPLHILASFVIDELIISAWVYFWVLYSVPLIYMSVLCQYHTVLITVALWYSLKLGTIIPPALFFLKIAFGYSGSFVFPYKFLNYLFQFCKNAIGIFFKIYYLFI